MTCQARRLSSAKGNFLKQGASWEFMMVNTNSVWEIAVPPSKEALVGTTCTHYTAINPYCFLLESKETLSIVVPQVTAVLIEL